MQKTHGLPRYFFMYKDDEKIFSNSRLRKYIAMLKKNLL